jgi:hypothetical protein
MILTGGAGRSMPGLWIDRVRSRFLVNVLLRGRLS